MPSWKAWASVSARHRWRSGKTASSAATPSRARTASYPGGGQRDLLPPYRRYRVGQSGSESNLVKTTTGIETNQKGLLTVSEDGSTTREGVFAGGDAVMGARTVVEAVAVAKKVAESMDAYMKSLPVDDAADPYADIPVFRTPTSDVLAKQEL